MEVAVGLPHAVIPHAAMRKADAKDRVGLVKV
jgi:hypothetical protein